MTAQKREAPSEPGAYHSLEANGVTNDTSIIEQGNSAYNVIQQGQRIGSFLSQRKAIGFAGQVTL